MSVRFDVPLLYRLLGVGEHESLRAVLRTARAASLALPHLVLSVFEQEGVRLGSGSADELRRARARAAGYLDMAERAAAGSPVDVMKGPALARRYPTGIVRPVGDLDLVVPDERTLWRVTQLIDAPTPAPQVDLSLLGDGQDRHTVVAVSWPADDPLLDRDVKVEISTMALPGDGVTVPVRARLPADPWLADLLSVTEERFQRAFTAKDVLDVLVLDDVAPDDLTTVADAAAHYRLAPELAELVSYAGSVVDLGALAPLPGLLAPHAERERGARAHGRPGTGVGGHRGVPAVAPRYGMALRTERRPELHAVSLHRAGGVHIARTPWGDFLLVDSGLVDPELYESALRELDRLPVGGATEGSPA